MGHQLIKMCGLSTPETIRAACDAGASHVGFVHFQPSPRHVSLARAAELRGEVAEGVKVVLLVVEPTPDLLADAVAAIRPDVVQFHGKESPEFLASVRNRVPGEIWKALAVRDAQSLVDARAHAEVADRLLFDAPPPADSPLPGGNGEGFDWTLLKGHDHAAPWGLAGGLNPDNVAEAIRATGAPLVDASSGLESAPGIKDVDRIAAFCKAALDYD